MNDVFSIASLVIAIAGATYMVIAGFRDCLQSEVDGIAETASSELSTINQSPNSTLKTNADHKRQLLVWWTRFWVEMFAVPTYVFATLSFVLVIHVLRVCWDDPTKKTDLWLYYRWGMAAIVVIDVVCGIIIRLIPCRLRSLAKGLHEDFNVRKNEIDLEQLVAGE